MTRAFAVAAVAACVLAVGGGVVAAAVPTASPTPVPLPGPKPPVEHLGLSGAMFKDSSGDPGCFTGEGSQLAGFAVPRGALVTGVTGYVIDTSTSAGVGVTLERHSLVTGGTHRLGSAFTTGNAGNTTVAIQLNPGVLVDEASGINVSVRVGDGTCFKGAEVHFIRNGAAALAQSPGTARAPEPTVTAAGPDGGLR